MSARTERLRLVLIGSTVLAATITLVLGVPRARAFLSPRIERVWVVSGSLGDTVASVEPKSVLQGTPVTLYALVEARSPFASETRLYGVLDEAVLAPGAAPRPVEAWRDWWLELQFLWFKVEPLNPFANPEFDPAFQATDLVFSDAYQVAWGFGARHAADVRPVSDAFPDLETGTMRFAARAVVRDWRERVLQQIESPGADAVHAADVVERPHRITVRAGDDPLGWLQAFGGLAYVPFAAAAADHPTPEFLGGTVLSFWLQAQRLAGDYAGPLADWESLPEVADMVVEEMFLASDGVYYWTRDPLRAVTWDDVRTGDMVVIEDHVGILESDRGPGGGGDGVVSRWDVAWEAYFEPLRTTPLGEAFEEGITVWRLREAGEPAAR